VYLRRAFRRLRFISFLLFTDLSCYDNNATLLHVPVRRTTSVLWRAARPAARTATLFALSGATLGDDGNAGVSLVAEGRYTRRVVFLR